MHTRGRDIKRQAEADQASEHRRLEEERRRENQQKRVEVVLEQVEARLRQTLEPLGQRDLQETPAKRLRQLVLDRQVQLMELWRE
jgi:hypothetical protein